MNQLRITTEFSFGETFAPLKRITERLKAIGAKAGGIVDPGTWGHVHWTSACKEAGITPLYGTRIAVVPDLAFEDRPAMWFLALNSAGLQELYRVGSLAQRQSAHGMARLTYADALKISGNIAKFAGHVLDGDLLRDMGAYVDFSPASKLVNQRKTALMKSHGLKSVVTSDNGYAAVEDRLTFEFIGSTARVTPQHLLTLNELEAELSGIDVRAAARRVDEIVEQASGVKLPKAPLICVEGNLETLCREGIVERGIKDWPLSYEQRLLYELEMIRSKKFESYFVMVADMVRYAKKHMLVGPSRGSAAGSLVCYLSRITEIDPIPAQLIFERFIDVTRNDLPDIDLDFPDSKRWMVIEYLREKYGKANVANIGTISTYKPKSALIAVAKKLGIPPWETDAVKDSIFERSSGDSRANFALLDTLKETEPGRKLVEKFPAIALAANIEAHASNSGVHAAGVLVCNDAIENYCTITADGIAQLDKKDAETLNLLKIDVLGLRTLGVLEDSGVDVDWYNLPLNDPAVFDIINRGRFAGIFQFEGSSLQSVSGQMTIKSLDDIGHITALARPGPMASGGTTNYLVRRAGKQEFRTPHPLMDKYVEDTFGVVVYQEQVLRICREIGKLEWEDTTSVRKAMSQRKGVEFFEKFRDVFLKGAAQEGIPKEAATEIWSQINTMGSWAFNLAHSYSYAVVSYWTAWLKAKHPLQFAAATLRNAKDDDSAIALLRELVQEGIEYVPFDPVLSEVNWSVKDGRLIGGFLGLRGIGESGAKKFVEERTKDGKLSEESLAKVMAAEKSFDDLFPTQRRFGAYYKEPEQFGIRPGWKVTEIKDIAGEAEFIFIGQLKGKDLRDHNEQIRVKRRDGKLKRGPTLFLDLDIHDDTGKILTRIERYQFEEIGRPIWEKAAKGTWWLVRGERKLWGRPDGGFKMIYVKKIKQLPDPFANQKGETK